MSIDNKHPGVSISSIKIETLTFGCQTSSKITDVALRRVVVKFFENSDYESFRLPLAGNLDRVDRKRFHEVWSDFGGLWIFRPKQAQNREKHEDLDVQQGGLKNWKFSLEKLFTLLPHLSVYLSFKINPSTFPWSIGSNERFQNSDFQVSSATFAQNHQKCIERNENQHFSKSLMRTNEAWESPPVDLKWKIWQ